MKKEKPKYCWDCIHCSSDYRYCYCELTGSYVLETDTAQDDPVCTAWKHDPDIIRM